MVKKKASKFNSILDAAKGKEEDTNLEEEKETSITKEEIIPIKNVKKGRPRGKRSNPDFEQVTAYIRSNTYRDVKIAILQQSEIDDFSELVEQLLNEWLSTQKAK